MVAMSRSDGRNSARKLTVVGLRRLLYNDFTSVHSGEYLGQKYKEENACHCCSGSFLREFFPPRSRSGFEVAGDPFFQRW